MKAAGGSVISGYSRFQLECSGRTAGLPDLGYRQTQIL
jgi:hypothetical protein